MAYSDVVGSKYDVAEHLDVVPLWLEFVLVRVFFDQFGERFVVGIG
jgi:hypothetical protein